MRSSRRSARQPRAIRSGASRTTYNTAGAGKFVRDQRDPGAAAVLSRRAAAAYGLDVLADSIQDDPENRTRFLMITLPGPVPDPAGGAAFRTTIAFGVRN